MKPFIFPILLVLCLSKCVNAQNQIDRGPYLQLATSHSIIIKWRTEDPTESMVWYGSSLSELNQSAQSDGTTTEHEVQISNLEANSYYYYAIGDSTGQLMGGDENFRFKTNPLPGSSYPFIAWIQGDPGTGGDVQRATRDGFLSYLGEQELNLMLVLGDNAYTDGKQSEYQDAFFEDMYEDLINKVVIWPTLGNHDAHEADSEDQSGPYYDIFSLPTDGEAGGIPSYTEAYYSYDYANVHFVVLNSVDIDRSSNGPMAQWLEADLNATNQDWIIAYFHHPIYSGANDNESDDGAEEIEMRENILPILEAHDIDLVLFGDTHNYQRSFMVKGHFGTSSTFDTLTMAVDYSNGNLEEGTPYTKLNQDGGAVFVVAGSAGKLEGEDEEDLQHPTMVKGFDELGSVSLEINGTQLDFKFILQDGSIADHFTILKEINPLELAISSPDNDAYFPSIQNITITAEASDPEGGVVQVAFYIDDLLIGIDENAPYAIDWHPLYANSYSIKAVATDTDGFTKSSTISIEVGQTSTTCVQVNQGSDDAEEKPNGSINLTSSDLELVEDGNDHQVIGIRFNNHNIPRGAAIANSYLSFKAKNDNNENPCELIIYGQTGINTTTFLSGTDNNISTRPKTLANMVWSPLEWDESGEEHISVNIGSIIQEIVLQDTYTAESAIVIIIEGTGRRSALSYDDDADMAPGLCITYDANNCLDTDFDGTCDIDDHCPGSPEPGLICNDNNSGTYDDVVSLNCICEGTPYDCPELAAQFGSPCDDNNSGTYDDTVSIECECVGILYDCPDLQMQFGAICNDNDSGTFDDIITTDCDCTGTPYDCPDLQLQFGTPCNDNNSFTCYDIITTDCNCVGTPTLGLTSNLYKINQGTDDAEEDISDGNVNINSSDLEISEDGTDEQIIGLRFTGTNIAPGSIISTAYLQFTVDETKNANPCNWLIFGEINPNAPTFTTDDNNVSNRTRTLASVSWSPNNWINVGDKGPDQQSPNIAPIIQEIIDQNGYFEGSPIVLVIEGEGRRVAVSYNGAASNTAELNISYGVSLPDEDGDGVCDEEDQCFGAEPGNTCDDGNDLTFNDQINSNCDCMGTLYDCPDFYLNIGDSCDDGNPGTFNDLLNDLCICLGTTFECPLLEANIGEPCSDNDPSTSNDIVNEFCICEGDPPIEVQLCDQVSANSDDAEQESNGSVSTSSSDLELAEDKGDVQIVGMRFTNLLLQQNTPISQAFLQFTVDKDNNVNPCNLTIYGELSTEGATFESTTDNISARPNTNANVSWSPNDWGITGESGPIQQSVDISSIIQEIVNQEGFSVNSPIVLMITGEGLRQAVAHDEDSQSAPELCVTAFISSSQPLTLPPNSSLRESQNTDSTLKVFDSDNEAVKIRDIKPNHLTNNSYLKVYPNPASNRITASFDLPIGKHAYLEVLDINGNTLNSKELTTEIGITKTQLNTTGLPNGVYFLTLQTEWERRIAKFNIFR